MSKSGRIDYTARDYASLRSNLLEIAGELMPEWTDHSPNDLGVVLVELMAHMGDVLHYYVDRVANESYLATAEEPRSVAHLLRLIGGEIRPPRAASADLYLLFEPATEAGARTFTLDTGHLFSTTAETTGRAVQFRYLGDPLTIDVDALEDVHEVEGELFARLVVPVTQVARDTDDAEEVIGSSDGGPGQRFRLPRRTVIGNTLRVFVDEGDGRVRWTPRATLATSGPSDRHYTVQHDHEGFTWIQLGDGRNGMIPPSGPNVLSARYFLGGGSDGNVGAFTIVDSDIAIDFLQRDGIFNPEAATGGADQETPREAAARGPQRLRTLGRAVTRDDYETLAREFGVAKVKAVAGNWGHVDLYVAPAGGGRPSETLKQDLEAWLDDKRMLNARVVVHGVQQVAINVAAEVFYQPWYDALEVESRARRAVQRVLDFEAVDLGAPLFLSKIYEALEAEEGVAGVAVSRVSREGGPALPPAGFLDFAAIELPVLGSLNLQLSDLRRVDR